MTRGYLEFKVDSTQVAILPNKTDIAITINVTEGERFIVSGVKLEGNFLGKEDEFKSLVTIPCQHQIFSADYPEYALTNSLTITLNMASRFCPLSCVFSGFTGFSANGEPAPTLLSS